VFKVLAKLGVNLATLAQHALIRRRRATMSHNFIIAEHGVSIVFENATPNDGTLIQELTHPKHDIEKEYYVTVRGKVSDEKLDNLKKGVTIFVDDKKYNTGKSIIKILRIFSGKK